MPARTSKGTITGVLVGALTLGGAAVLALRRLSGHAGSDQPEPRERWRAVTVNRSAEEVMPGGQRPVPLAGLGDEIEVEVRSAPGGRGTELRARFVAATPSSLTARVGGDDPHQRLRQALRDAKQLIEVGEVLRVDPRPHGRRAQTPQGKLLDLAVGRAKGEGLL